MIKTNQKALSNLKENQNMREFLGGCQIKITDFGVSFQLNDEFDLTHSITGTQNYQAPEVSLGEGYQLSSDIFSLG